LCTGNVNLLKLGGRPARPLSTFAPAGRLLCSCRSALLSRPLAEPRHDPSLASIPTLGRPSWLASEVGSLVGSPRESGALKDFIVVNRLTRKIVAEFGTREEAEAFRDGLISAQPNGKSDLSIRSTLGDSTDQEAGAAQRAEKRGRTPHPLRRKQSRGPRRPGP
jgi:hypothetical protein